MAIEGRANAVSNLATRPPYRFRCDNPGCKERHDGQPWQKSGQVRAYMRELGWVAVLVRHSSSPGGLSTRRVDDLCPKHAGKAATWSPKETRGIQR